MQLDRKGDRLRDQTGTELPLDSHSSPSEERLQRKIHLL